MDIFILNMKKFNYKDYYLNEESIFINDEFKNEFYNMLKEQHNTDPFDFIFDVLELINLYKNYDEKYIIKKCNEIIELYIIDKSKKELNLSYQIKKNFLENFKLQENNNNKWILKINVNDLFNEILNFIKIELLYDKFSIFVRRKETIKLIKKYYKNTNLIINRITKDFNYTLKDLEDTLIITEKDIELLDTISNDSFEWIITKKFNKNNIKTISYFSNNVQKYISSLKMNNSSIVKVEIFSNLNFNNICDIVFNFENSNGYLFHKDILYYNKDSTKNYYNNLNEEIKWNFNKIRNERTTSIIEIYFNWILNIITKVIWINSFIYDKKEKKLTMYTKIPLVIDIENNKIKNNNKNNTKNEIDNNDNKNDNNNDNKIENKIDNKIENNINLKNVKSASAFQKFEIKYINDNKTLFTIISCGLISTKYKLITDLFFKEMSKKIAKQYIELFSNYNKNYIKSDNLLFKQIDELFKE